MRDYKGKSIIALPLDFIVIDTETTGLDYEYCNIIEVAAVRYSNGKKIDTYTSLVKPPAYYTYDENGNKIVKYVDEFITDLTGITNEMLASAPEPDIVIPRFLTFIGDSVLVAHNANFDINFIYDAAMGYCNIALRNDFIDTLRIARKVFPDLKHHRLVDIVGACHINQVEAHRAEADCLITAQCYEHMRYLALSKYSEEEFIRLFKKRKKSYIESLAAISPTVEIDEDNPVFGKVVVFTGALSSMERRKAFQIVVNLGGIPSNRITKKTNYLVIGNSDFVSSVKDGKTNKMKAAEEYQKKGCEILVLSEDFFFDMISEYIVTEGATI